MSRTACGPPIERISLSLAVLSLSVIAVNSSAPSVVVWPPPRILALIGWWNRVRSSRPQRDPVVQADPALVDRVHRRDRDPQLGTALLREQGGGVVVGLPAVAERHDRNAGPAVERAAEGGDAVAQGRRRDSREAAGAGRAAGRALRLGGAWRKRRQRIRWRRLALSQARSSAIRPAPTSKRHESDVMASTPP